MIHGAGFLFDGVQPADTPQGFFGCRVGTADLKVKELAPRMRPAAQFDNHLPILAREQLLVSDIVVHHEAALPALQEIPCMLAGPAALIIEHHNRQAGIQIVAAVTPQVRPFGLARPGSSCLTGVSSACSTCRCLSSSINRSTRGCRANPMRPIHSLRVLRDRLTCCRAAICSRRHSGK